MLPWLGAAPVLKGVQSFRRALTIKASCSTNLKVAPTKGHLWGSQNLSRALLACNLACRWRHLQNKPADCSPETLETYTKALVAGGGRSELRCKRFLFTQRVQVPLEYIHRPQSRDIVTPLRSDQLIVEIISVFVGSRKRDLCDGSTSTPYQQSDFLVETQCLLGVVRLQAA